MTDYLLPADDEVHEVEKDLARLTGIRDKYTLATTPEQGSETDTLMINNFLTTLAEIALAIASRSTREQQEGDNS
ncbi:MAG: hypothetical protein HOC20_11920 [Chloroflexi bacterium]|jgi:hypothetical protein|nr:hypothetical protein [Chloroflexota bacterium]